VKASSAVGWSCRRPWVLALVLGLGLLMAWARSYFVASRPDRVTVLNGLRDEINANYGDKTGTPRINCGPCARFAIAFRERWNARFREKINLVCVLSPDRNGCGHVALKLPDGSCFDGGNGVLSEQTLRTLYPNYPIEEMVEFNRKLLDQRVGGLDHDYYPECPNYSEALTVKLIEKHLALLAND
jgi:hypothetical protein